MNSKEIKATIERLRSQYEKGLGYSLDDVACAFLGESYGMRVALSSKFRDALIALLEQADPSTYMGLPKDVDGEVIHIGDELCGYGRTIKPSYRYCPWCGARLVSGGWGGSNGE